MILILPYVSFFFYLLRKSGNMYPLYDLNDLYKHYHLFMRFYIFGVYKIPPKGYGKEIYNQNYVEDINRIIPEKNKFDVLFIDEAQDLSSVWIKNLSACVKRNGSIVVITSKKQLIYYKKEDKSLESLFTKNCLFFNYQTKEVYRFNVTIKRLAAAFSNHFFHNKFLLDSKNEYLKEPVINYYKLRNLNICQIIEYIRKIKENLKVDIDILTLTNPLGMMIDYRLRRENIYEEKNIKKTFLEIEQLIPILFKHLSAKAILDLIFSAECFTPPINYTIEQQKRRLKN